MGYLGQGLVFLPSTNHLSTIYQPSTIPTPLLGPSRHPRLQHLVFFFEHFHFFDMVALKISYLLIK